MPGQPLPGQPGYNPAAGMPGQQPGLQQNNFNQPMPGAQGYQQQNQPQMQSTMGANQMN